MTLKNIKSKGFTIVELLVVIVVIGILATITFVSYGGVTARANTAKGQSMASSIVDRASLYTIQGTTGTWPITVSGADGAATSTAVSSTVISGYTLDTDGITVAPATTTTTISFQVCGTTNSTTVTTAPASLAALTGASGFLTGVRASYWDYSTGAQVFVGSGNYNPGSVGPYRTSAGVTYANLVACFYVTS